MIDEWQAEGVGTHSVLRVPTRLPEFFAIRTDARGERQFHYWRDQAPARDLFNLPDATIDVGTMLKAHQIQCAADLGDKFAVSSGFGPPLTETAAKAGLFCLPGVATATEVMAARRAGLRFLKFFPAEQAGGVALLESFA